MDGPSSSSRITAFRSAKDRVRGWGRVSIPADENPADNEFYFVFDEPPPRRTIIVAEDRAAGAAAGAGRGSSPDPAVKCEVEGASRRTIGGRSVGAGGAPGCGQRRCPRARRPISIRKFVSRGGQVVFFPPRDARRRRRFRTRVGRIGRRRPSRSASKPGAATRTCWPARKAARRCRSAS